MTLENGRYKHKGGVINGSLQGILAEGVILIVEYSHGWG